jgi:NADH-quinone oxidoreductase subunit G
MHGRNGGQQQRIELRKPGISNRILLINHPLDCPVCDQAGECDLQDLSFEHGKGKSRFIEDKRTFEPEDINIHLHESLHPCYRCHGR